MKPSSTVAVPTLGTRSIWLVVGISRRKILSEPSALNGNMLSLQKRLGNHFQNGVRDILPVSIARAKPSRAQSASPPAALPANTDSASVGTPATGRPGASTAGLPTPRPFHSTSPPCHGGPHRGRPDGGRAQDSPRGSPVSASWDSGRIVPRSLT